MIPQLAGQTRKRLLAGLQTNEALLCFNLTKRWIWQRASSSGCQRTPRAAVKEEAWTSDQSRGDRKSRDSDPICWPLLAANTSTSPHQPLPSPLIAITTHRHPSFLSRSYSEHVIELLDASSSLRNDLLFSPRSQPGATTEC